MEICSRCREPIFAAPEAARVLVRAYGESEFARDYPSLSVDRLQLFAGRGCELLVASEPMKAAILRRASIPEIRELSCSEGMKTLVQDGVDKALRGDTDMKQVLSVCH